MAEITNKELLEMAKRANSAEEFLALAKENDLEFTREQAEVYFEQINNSGELSDDDLQNVSGGYDIPRIISPYSYCCKSYVCALRQARRKSSFMLYRMD